ncbi:ribonuclease E inhibitor RraB [Paroceanicella profunda]|uniref:Ribonuclease E inhibitor RraB n=1 Tax=Paroceanicella profunda TaxID=2579971 RepID=A0A5B8FSE7_9RHOB|nr:ribonuclease E inhibitor RraB [Paroceanicella profunda]QDL91696.1 ribonuclease E inhibitor RraB [Paroceanicella profunda]
MSDETWDWAEQRRDTEFTYAELKKEAGIAPGTVITLDLQFLPAETDSDEEAFMKALSSFGYDVNRYEEDDTVEATVEGVPFTIEDIWVHEERTTKIALARGFAPDGWGFWDPNDDSDEDDADDE